jgi:dTMP kinase
MRGKFITFEGGEGSGKTTQISLLSQELQRRGIEHLVTREPGGTVLAEKIRPLVVESQQLTDEDWSPLAETLLFLAARMQHWQHKIRPALAKGQWVLCDRFIDSTLVYQGIGKGLGVAYLQGLHRYLNGTEWLPDRTFLLDVPPAMGLQRAATRHHQETRFEELDTAFHQQLREGFLMMARNESPRFQVIDATQAVESVQQSILSCLV